MFDLTNLFCRLFTILLCPLTQITFQESQKVLDMEPSILVLRKKSLFEITYVWVRLVFVLFGVSIACVCCWFVVVVMTENLDEK